MDQIIVIGGGAAGMMAALAAAEDGKQVLLIERNEKLGKKLFITGKGRCNVTNACDMEGLFANICNNEKFLYSAFYTYDNHAVMELLEKAGCPLKIERGDRVFPVSDHSSDVIGALTRELQKRKVQILYNTRVVDIGTEEMLYPEAEASCDTSPSKAGNKRPGYKIINVTLDNGRILSAKSVIVCTGGKSYPTTGSTGDGYIFAESTGHRLTDRKPALVPLNCQESWCKELMGLSLRNVSLCLKNGKKELYSGFGEMLFTHFGITGPLVLSASSYYMKAKKSGDTYAYIDLKPALSPEQLDKRLLRDFEENKNKQFRNSLAGLFPGRLIPVMIDLSGILPEKKVNEITKEERQRFGQLIKNLPLKVIGTRDFAEAIITQGGVSVKDVNPSTMESKKVSGLFFAGEVLDVDAMTGGFNLQIAWSTGYLAGKNA
ncbi:MAG: NAD(P)/FAD-dependent oxidoreductase [Lachnospiraceae bacterium]|nr:NAD(P)/FAD-dependent oxidoreductase [Lachnospiraceae bacterium]